ncbi:MAG TPA: hypothetical protein VGM23_09995 [Armatimonadota bacterium]|jgi:hypothetical protein
MQSILAIIVIVGSVLGLAFAALSASGAQRTSRWQAFTTAGLRPLFLFAAGAIVLLFLATVPSFHPFSSGLTLGWGFLIGALLGLYVLYQAPGEDESARVVGTLAAACLGPGLILLIFRGYPNEALIGCALGAVLLAVISGSVLRPLALIAPSVDSDAMDRVRAADLFAMATAAVAAGAWLGIERFPRPAPAAPQGGYWVLPVLLLTAGMLATIAFSVGRRATQRWNTLVTGSIAGIAAAVVAGVLSIRVFPKLPGLLPLYGLLAFAFILGMLLTDDGAERASARPTAFAFSTVLIVLALAAISFKGFQGYGQTLALISAVLVLAPTYLNKERANALAQSLGAGGVTVLLLLVLFRLFNERAGHGWILDFQQQYDFIAVILGAGACFALLAFTKSTLEHARGRKSPIAGMLPRTILLGVLLTIVPLTIAAVWGTKTVGAFLGGLVLAETIWMMLAAWTTGPDRDEVLAAAPHAILLAMALVIVQFTPLILSFEFSRPTKLILISIVTLGLIAWALIDTWRQGRNAALEVADEHVA